MEFEPLLTDEQFHDKYVDKLGWVDEQMVSLLLDFPGID